MTANPLASFGSPAQAGFQFNRRTWVPASAGER